MALTKEQALKQVGRLYAVLASRWAEVERYDRYFRGKQPLQFASPKFREFNRDRYKGFADNWCAPVASAPNERLEIIGFRLDDSDTITDAERMLWRDWLRNEMEMQSSQGFLKSIVAKRSAVIVWGNADDEPIATWEAPDQVVVGYDPAHPTRRVAALKVWTDGEMEFATLYTDDQVWKFERKRAWTPATPTTSVLHVVGDVDPGKWETRQPKSDDSWPLTHDLGVVPVVEFPNRPMLGGEPISDIEGAIAMQDAINLLWAYLFNAADFASLPARVVMGAEPPVVPILDKDGQIVGEQVLDLKKLAEDRILWLTGGEKIGQWDAAKLDVFTGVVEIAVAHLAAQTRTPQHYLIGKAANTDNAEALKAAETGLVCKVGEMTKFLNPASREVFRLFALVRGQKDVAEMCRYATTQWKNPENRSDAQLADAALKMKQVGYPLEWILRYRGHSLTEIAEIKRMIEAEANDPTMAALMRELNGAPGVG